MPKETLHGYWTNKENPSIYIAVEKVFKKGYVTGFKYAKTTDGEVIHPPFKMSQEDLLSKYERGLPK